MFTRRAKDIQRCLRSIGSFTEDQARVVDCDYDELKSIKIELVPNEGPYKGGRFIFTIGMTSQFPEVPPDVTCETNIYHPNIDPTTDELNVCLSLFDEWESTFGLEDTIQGLLFLFHEPNLEDPLSPYFSGESYDSFDDDVLKSMKGESVDGMRFDIVLDITTIESSDICNNKKSEQKQNNSSNEEKVPVDFLTSDVEALTLENAIDIVEIVREMVTKVSDDKTDETESALNAKNEIEGIVCATSDFVPMINDNTADTDIGSREAEVNSEDPVNNTGDQNCDIEMSHASGSGEPKETDNAQGNAQESAGGSLEQDSDSDSPSEKCAEVVFQVLQSPVTPEGVSGETSDPPEGVAGETSDTPEGASGETNDTPEGASDVTSDTLEGAIGVTSDTPEGASDTPEGASGVTAGVSSDSGPPIESNTCEPEQENNPPDVPQEIDTPVVVPRLDFDDIETIMEKVDHLLATKGEENDKKEEDEIKKMEEEDASDCDEDETEEQVANNEVSNQEEATISEAQEDTVHLATNISPPAEPTPEVLSLNVNNSDAYSTQRPDCFNRQTSKIEKFDLVLERISHEHKSTQTDFNMLLGNMSFLKYAGPTNTVALLVNPELEYAAVLLLSSLWKYFVSSR